jgi:exodeoxyribonuclease VII small subunit
MAKHESKKKIASDADGKTYQAMLSELDEIVRTVGHGQLDLDQVVEKIEHGYKLISVMRHRLDQTKAKVEALRVDFEKSSSAESTSATDKGQKINDAEDDEDLPF